MHGVRGTICLVEQCCRGSGSSSHVMSIPVLLNSDSQLHSPECECLVGAGSHLRQLLCTLRPFEILTYMNVIVQHNSSR